MDTSKEYIKQCDCPEVQGKKRFFKQGDWAYENAKHGEVITVGRYGYISNTQLSSCGYDYDFFEYKRKRFVFLPRQDQIQEMIGKDHETTLDLLVHFYGFVTVDNPMGIQKIFNALMEQLWLAFYMHEKHKKTWTGEKWTKSE